MEVADQWRREWAGTAEYGKVTEGGVTRRIARAMEVLHASGPGSRMRVMRAAYHSTAGPGAPAESFMLHSSRRVFSSNFNFLESPSFPTKPLEISSTPLELATPDSNGENENYKVTEPDDLEISEPSKWKGSSRGSTIRMPSEESSSTDNTSIIDLDARGNKNNQRKYSYDSESSDIQFRSRSNSRSSQILDAPSTLSTLKYKSLLNNSNDWNNRRKSYSFEDTSPLNETILHSNDTLAMESSTDSGICKSTELVNDHTDDNSHIRYFGKTDDSKPNKENSFQDWLSRNRQNSQYKGTKFKTYREHEIVLEDPKENNIALKSAGKVSITLPVTLQGSTDDEYNSQKTRMTEEAERRVKRVEFCKTEVHFAAESGRVNIIATDEKPPPTYDFRKRRSAFVPMQDMSDRPITLFGEKHDYLMTSVNGSAFTNSNGDIGDSDENTAATKSILKNKIPKPKPYLLGENMDFRISDDVSTKTINNAVPTGVSLVNQQLESEKRYKTDMKSVFTSETGKNVVNDYVFRTINSGPYKTDNFMHEKPVVTTIKTEVAKVENVADARHKLNSLQSSPVQAKAKTRQLRESDLTYFGIHADQNTKHKNTKRTENKPKADTKISSDKVLDSLFHSVKLIQQVSNSVSNSVCNSEPESEEAPEYQNLSLNINYAPVPTPRLRSKPSDIANEINEVRAGLRPTNRNTEDRKDTEQLSTRRSKVRKHEETKANRSLSEPPKNFRRNVQEKTYRREDQSSSSNQYHHKHENSPQLSIIDRKLSEEDIPIYVNLHIDKNIVTAEEGKQSRNKISSRQREPCKTDVMSDKSEAKTDTLRLECRNSPGLKEHRTDSRTESSHRRHKHKTSSNGHSGSLTRDGSLRRDDKKHKTHSSVHTDRSINEEAKHNKQHQIIRENKHKSDQNIIEEKSHNSRSIQRASPKAISNESAVTHHDHSIKHRDTSNRRKRHSSKEKNNSTQENIKPSEKLDSETSPRLIPSPTKQRGRDKEASSRHGNHRTNKHREYVINYDDKNGTVSSICKIKPSSGSPRRTKASREILKENQNEIALKNKSIDKIPLRK